MASWPYSNADTWLWCQKSLQDYLQKIRLNVERTMNVKKILLLKRKLRLAEIRIFWSLGYCCSAQTNWACKPSGSWSSYWLVIYPQLYEFHLLEPRNEEKKLLQKISEDFKEDPFVLRPQLTFAIWFCFLFSLLRIYPSVVHYRIYLTCIR